MAEPRDLLVEIGTEELPPKALRRLAEAFAAGLAGGLDRAGIARGAARAYATPRRLAVLVEAVAPAQPDRTVRRRGPAVQAAFDAEGRPTKAAEGFARSVGVPVERLGRLRTDKGEWLLWEGVEPGRPTAELLPGLVQEALERLPVPKRMRWGAGEVAFVRPVHWLLMLHGEDVVPGTVLGLEAGRETRGHRFHHPDPIPVPKPVDWEPLLASRGHVIADMDRRRAAVRAQVEEAALAAGGRAVVREALLEEVTALVEWPVALAGRFDERFLELPREVVVSAMEQHQKCFPVVDAAGALLARFVAVANIESRDPEEVRRGNERVIRPRLADAAFFWEQDRRRPLESRLEQLRGVVYQERLGTLHDKTLRLERLAADVAGAIGADVALARRAARLAKCDLVTEMVGEFPELQGVMGRYYALHDGEPEAVAVAIEEHYRPRGAGDAIAATPVGRAVALADRLDTLVGIFACGLRPTGEKDPYGLRRAALGILRTLIEGGLDLDLARLAEAALDLLPEGLPQAEGAADAAVDFALDRLRAWYQERGMPVEVYEAVRARGITRPLDFDRRVRAVLAFRELPEAEALAAAHKRIRNILRQAREKGLAVAETVDPSRLAEPAERALHEAVARAEAEIAAPLAAGDYEAALRRLAALRGPVDAFFDQVLVMAEDEAVRANRLALLRALAGLFLEVADIGRLPAP
ncbi:MAG TPA: glycine--tRNA ligase subunit beta [Chromatiales bacterium]|nr:glycine--tRNA ligase subunit beta [Chromatiales bacterium]